MRIPILFGQPLHMWLGILLFILIVFQIAVAKKLIPVSFQWHRIMGYVILLLAMLHGSIAFGLYNGLFTGPPSEPEGNTVIIEDYAFQPAEITIQSGESVTWINKDSVKHTATGGSFDSGLFGKDESFQQTFDATGTYDYICTPHPYMKGTVIVEE